MDTRRLAHHSWRRELFALAKLSCLGSNGGAKEIWSIQKQVSRQVVPCRFESLQTVTEMNLLVLSWTQCLFHRLLISLIPASLVHRLVSKSIKFATVVFLSHSHCRFVRISFFSYQFHIDRFRHFFMRMSHFRYTWMKFLYCNYWTYLYKINWSIISLPNQVSNVADRPWRPMIMCRICHLFFFRCWRRQGAWISFFFDDYIILVFHVVVVTADC